MSERGETVVSDSTLSSGGIVAHVPEAVAPARRRFGTRNTDLALLAVGALLNLVAYLSFVPLLVAFIYFSSGMGLLIWPRLGGLYERRIFRRVFAVGFLMAGIAAIYANYFEDPGQLGSDARTFFDFASGQASGITLDDLTVFFEGALAIVLWGAIYDLFAGLGFPRERYVGILLNVTTVAATGVISIKIARQIYGHDIYRFRRLILLFATCGLLWLFASIHIRDSMVFFAATALAYTWLYFLARPDLNVRLVQLVGVSIAATFFFMFIRREFVFVPAAMAVAGLSALLVGRKTKQNRSTAYVLLLIGLLGIAALLSTYAGKLVLALTMGQEGYMDLAYSTHGSDSLGMTLIANQPLPIRVVMGSVALLLLPIPVWIGIQLESVYHLFGSLNALFFYFFIPLLALAIRQLWKQKALRTPSFLFILFAPAGFTFAVAATSMETRHFGAFLVPLFVLALLPDLRLRSAVHNYRQLLGLMLSGVVLVHVLWVVLKAA